MTTSSNAAAAVLRKSPTVDEALGRAAGGMNASYVPPKVDPLTGRYITNMPEPIQGGRRFQPTAPVESAPRVAETAKEAAKTAGEGASAGGKAGRALNVLGRAAAAAAMLDAVRGSLEPDSTERYAERFGMSPPTGDGSVKDIAKFAALRTLGYASDLGDNLTGGLAGKYLYRDHASRGSAPTSFVANAVVPPEVAPSTQKGGAPNNVPAAGREARPADDSAGDLTNAILQWHKNGGQPPAEMVRDRVYKIQGPDGKVLYAGVGSGQAPKNPYEFQGGIYDGKNRQLESKGTLSIVPPSVSREEVALRDTAKAMDVLFPKPIRDTSAAEKAQTILSNLPTRPEFGESQGAFLNRRDAMLRQAEILSAMDKNASVEYANALSANAQARQEYLRSLSAEKANASKLAETARVRDVVAKFQEAANGDMRVAAELAMRSGMPELADTFLKLAKESQQYMQESRQDGLQALMHLATPGPDEKIPEHQKAMLRAVAESVAPGFFNMSPQEQIRVLPDVEAAIKLVMGHNRIGRETRLWQTVPIVGDGPDPALTRLPEMTGGVLREIQPWSLDVIGKPSARDYVVDLPKGQKLFLPRDILDESVMGMLKKRGVNIGSVEKSR